MASVRIDAPVVLGINFGSSFSSIAVINKEGLSDVIADEDGARQIANAVSFSGEEEYIGIPGRKQLVRNNANTILRFRDLLGKSYEEAKAFKPVNNSAPIINHQGQPAFQVTVNGKETALTASDVTVKFLRTLFTSAKDFLGKSIESVVFAVPADFTPAQSKALQEASAKAGVKTASTISDVGAAAQAYKITDAPSLKFSAADKNVLFLDVGASTTTATVVAVRQGLLVPLSTVRDTASAGDEFDQKLVEFFSKEFTKKTKVTLDKANHRAITKLLLEVESTKRTLSASTSANCAVESLAEGMDYSGVINRTRFDLISNKVYQAISDRVLQAVKEASLDPVDINEIVLMGGSARLPTLSQRIADLFPSQTRLTSQIDSDEVIARGAVLQAQLLSKPSSANVSPQEIHTVTSSSSVLSKPIGLLVGKDRFVTLLDQDTPLPARKVLDVQVPEGSEKADVVISLWEGKHEILVEDPPKTNGTNGKSGNSSDADEDESDEEPEQIKTAIVKAEKSLADLKLTVDATVKGDGRKAATRPVRLTLIIDQDSKGRLEALQSKKGAEAVSITF